MKSFAIVGEMGAGKTTLADELVQNFGYTRVSFARRLKELAADAFGGEIRKDGLYRVAPDDLEEGVEAEVLSGRAVLQQLGQSVKSFDRLLWVRLLVADLERGVYGDGPYVSDDCRFPYEAYALHKRGFQIVRLITEDHVRMARYEALYGRRPTLAEMTHPSELEVRRIRADIVVDGTDSPWLLASRLVSKD